MSNGISDGLRRLSLTALLTLLMAAGTLSCTARTQDFATGSSLFPVTVEAQPLAANIDGVFLVHALVDWDWELPAVTLVGLLCGCALVVAGRTGLKTRGLAPPVRTVAVGAIVLLGAFAAIGLVGNSALKASGDARQSLWARWRRW